MEDRRIERIDRTVEQRRSSLDALSIACCDRIRLRMEAERVHAADQHLVGRTAEAEQSMQASKLDDRGLRTQLCRMLKLPSRHCRDEVDRWKQKRRLLAHSDLQDARGADSVGSVILHCRGRQYELLLWRR